MAASSEGMEAFEIVVLMVIIVIAAAIMVYILLRTGFFSGPELIGVQATGSTKQQKSIDSQSAALAACRTALGSQATLATKQQMQAAVSQGAQYCMPGWVADDSKELWWPMQEPDTTKHGTCGGGSGPGAESQPASQVGAPVANCIAKRPLTSGEAVVDNGDLTMLPWYAAFDGDQTVWSRALFTTYGPD